MSINIVLFYTAESRAVNYKINPSGNRTRKGVQLAAVAGQPANGVLPGSAYSSLNLLVGVTTGRKSSSMVASVTLDDAVCVFYNYLVLPYFLL